MHGEKTAIDLTKNLVRIDSSNPGAGEGVLCDYLTELLGPAADVTERKEVLPGRENLRVSLLGDPKEPALIFICHMDTVTLGEGWTKDPLKAQEEAGRIYGRGACDMKSGLACAAAAFLEAAGWERPFLCTLTFIATVDEEGEMRGVEQAIADGWIRPGDYVLDLEPTDGKIRVGHKGRTWFALDIQGTTAHASTPWMGADAIAGAAVMIDRIRKEIQRAPKHPELGASTVTFGMITGGYQPYVVPDHCQVTVDMRLVPPMNTREAEKLLKNAIAAGEAEVPGVKGSYRVTGDRPPIEKDPHSPLLAKLREAVEAVTGKAEVDIFTGYTDTAVVAAALENPSCMSYGPGSLELAHKPDESVAVEDISRCVRVLVTLVRKLLKGGE